MANLRRHHFGWVGHGFHPGVEHRWWVAPINFGEVLHVTAHPVTLMAREVMVKELRTHVDRAGKRTLFFTVRNTGPNVINGYGVDVSVVSG